MFAWVDVPSEDVAVEPFIRVIATARMQLSYDSVDA